MSDGRHDGPRVQVVPVAEDHPDAVALRLAMYQDLASLYPRQTAEVEARGGFAWLEARRAGTWRDVLVAYVDDGAVGCAGTRAASLPDTPAGSAEEVRALFVRRTARRRGVARALHAALVERARARGARVLLLETGTRQAPALATYESLGWRPTGPFEPHAPDPTSRYLRLDLPP